MADKNAPREALERVLKLKVVAIEDYPFLQELQLPPEFLQGLTLDDVFWLQLVWKSLHGDMKAMQEVLDRRYGKAQQHIVQETHNYSYTDFLDKIEAEERQMLQVHDVEPIVIAEDDLPQVDEPVPPGTGVPSGDDALRDLGFFDE